MDPTPEIILTDNAKAELEGYRTSRQTQVLTILLSDMEGSTRQQTDLGNERAAKLVQRHRAVFRELLAKFDGQEVETAGDSFLVAFAAPSEAMAFALHMQAAMRQERQDAPEIPAVRVGLHQGQVVVEHHATGGKTMDIYGVQVSTAARIMDLANGGQILCSRAVFDDARSVLKEEHLGNLEKVVWCNHGPYHFKGVEDTYDVCEVGEEGLAPLKAPVGGNKGWPAGQSGEELGWRPAAGVTVPGTNWLLEERLGKTDESSSSHGKYKGEFGEVWKARNSASRSGEVFKFCFKRDRVPALKREARLLKSLQKHRHPNLVEVYDVTEGDRPPYYLEMEYVEGPSLEDWLRTNPALGERLEIIAQVADALDTVHAAGIYHRDIKPSNILLTHRQDGALQAKLTDFGLGAAEDKNLLQSIQMSRVDGVAGTWDYLAPELRKGQSACAQSDLYSLGITLYQVVTGDLERPLAGDWESQVASEVLREDIRRCVASEASDRWRTAGELARALRSHDQRLRELQLERERQQQQKRAKRLRLIAGLASAFAVVTLGLGGLAWHQRNVAETQRQEAQHQRDIADKQRSKAEENEQKAKEERDRAQRLFATGKKFADFTIFDLEPAIENLAGSTPARKMLVDQSLAYLQDLQSHAGNDTALLWSIFAAYEAVGNVQGSPATANLGDIRGSIESYRKALAIVERLAAADPTNAPAQQDLGACYSQLGDVQVNQGDLTGAMENYRKGLAIHQKLAAADPANAEIQRELSISYNQLGHVQVNQGDPAGAADNYRKSQAISEKLAAADPTNVEVQRDLSLCYERFGDMQAAKGNPTDAMENYRKVLAIVKRLAAADPTNAQAQRDLSLCYGRLGDVQVTQGDLTGAMENYRNGLAITEKLAAADPTNAQAQRDLSLCYVKLGDVQVTKGDLTGAMDSYGYGLYVTENLAAANPTNAQAKGDLSLCYVKLGDVQVDMGNLTGAMENYRKVLAIREKLAAADPTNARTQRDLGACCERLGDMQQKLGDLRGAMENYRKSQTISEKLAAGDPTNVEVQRDLSLCYQRFGDMQAAKGDPTDAVENYRKVLAIVKRLAAANPTNAQAQRDLSLCYGRLGNVQVALGNLTGAMEDYRNGLAITEKLAAADPTDARAQWELSAEYQKLGDVQRKLGDHKTAIESYRKGLAVDQRLAEAHPNYDAPQRDLAFSLNRVGCESSQMSDPNGALENYRKALDIRQRLADANPKNATYQLDLSDSLKTIGGALSKAGNNNGAIDSYGKALKIAEALLKLDPQNALAKERLAEIQTLLAACRQPASASKPAASASKSATSASKPASVPSTQQIGQ